jgi:hypothetical protein
MIFVFEKIMKKLLLALLLISKSVLFAQTVLTSYPLDFRQTDDYDKILNVENTQTHDVFVFAANQENITILKYNNALFLNDQFSTSRINLEDKILIGYSFGDDGNPSLYWASVNLKDIIVVKYYMDTKTVKMLKFNFPFSTQYMAAFFQKNDTFYILSKDKEEQTLILYIFKNGKVEEKVFNFLSFIFQEKNTQFVTFNKLINENSIEKIDTDDFTPLDKSTKTNKVYLINDHLILTLDHNPKKTQVLDLDIENHTINERSFPQSIPDNTNKISNSFFNDNKLYQISASKYAISFDIKDYKSGQTIKNVTVLKNDTIKFKNSPFLLQIDDRKPTELKKTSQFLNHLAFLDIGLSAYKNKQNTFVTIGGTPKEEGFYQYYDGDFASIDHTESVYFETALNNNSEFIKDEQQPLAIDNIFYFLSLQKKASFQNIFKFKDYYILGYYDGATKQYIMRRFTDGFIQPDITNPIIDKSQFSKPAKFEKLKLIEN